VKKAGVERIFYLSRKMSQPVIVKGSYGGNGLEVSGEGRERSSIGTYLNDRGRIGLKYKVEAKGNISYAACHCEGRGKTEETVFAKVLKVHSKKISEKKKFRMVGQREKDYVLSLGEGGAEQRWRASYQETREGSKSLLKRKSPVRKRLKRGTRQANTRGKEGKVVLHFQFALSSLILKGWLPLKRVLSERYMGKLLSKGLVKTRKEREQRSGLRFLYLLRVRGFGLGKTSAVRGPIEKEKQKGGGQN